MGRTTLPDRTRRCAILFLVFQLRTSQSYAGAGPDRFASANRARSSAYGRRPGPIRIPRWTTLRTGRGATAHRPKAGHSPAFWGRSDPKMRRRPCRPGSPLRCGKSPKHRGERLAEGILGPAERRWQRRRSRPVTRVNSNVLLGQIAGPEAGAAARTAANREPDQALRAIQLLLELVLGKIGCDSASANPDSLHIDIHLARVEGHARVASGGKNPAPVRVGAGDGGFHQQRIGDGPRHSFGGAVVGGADDLNRHQLARALAVPDDL